MTQQEMVASGEANICAESFGKPGDPAVLLIMGQMASMLWWPEGFCRRLAERGRFVIRYDNRDTGRSTNYEPGQPAYGLDDLLDDALAVLDSFGLERAHIVGMSLGGGVGQLLALEHPERVATLTAISTTPIGEPAPELPDSSAEYTEHAAAFERVDWLDTDALTELLVADARQVASTQHPFDEDATREFVERDLARTKRPPSLVNHAMLGPSERVKEGPEGLQPRLLVSHGSSDPVFPHPHGVALAGAVPGARLLTIEGGGHELHEADWGLYLDAIDAHTAVD